MRFSTLYWWEWAAYAFGFLSITINALWLLTTFRERPTPIGGPPSIPTLPSSSEYIPSMPRVERRGKRTVWISSLILALAIGLLVGTGGGYAIRDHQVVSNTVFYTAVTIHSPSQPDTDFDIQPARMQPIPSKICRSLVDWKIGETLKDLTFEQEHGCKRVISYHRYPQGEKLDVAIQMR